MPTRVLAKMAPRPGRIVRVRLPLLSRQPSWFHQSGRQGAPAGRLPPPLTKDVIDLRKGVVRERRHKIPIRSLDTSYDSRAAARELLL